MNQPARKAVQTCMLPVALCLAFHASALWNIWFAAGWLGLLTLSLGRWIYREEEQKRKAAMQNLYRQFRDTYKNN